MAIYDVTSIEAMPDDFGGWTWNDQWREGQIEIEGEKLTTRKILRVLRDEGYLSEYSKGRVRVDWLESYMDEGSVCEIQHKDTYEPLFFISKHDGIG